jgi:hypothetical protein
LHSEPLQLPEHVQCRYMQLFKRHSMPSGQLLPREQSSEQTLSLLPSKVVQAATALAPPRS